MITRGKRILKGMTWDHSRGYLPMVASGQRFEELNPEVEVRWEKRSLKDFEEYPVEVLAKSYDMIVIDHPFVGYAAKNGPLLALDKYLPAEFLADQREHSVGKSHESYAYQGSQWGLAIDAAAPVAFWREDLAEKFGVEIPRDWTALRALARAGHVEIPAAPINCLMNFYSLCLALGEEPFAGEESVVSRSVGLRAIEALRELIELCDPACWSRNPIGSHDLLSSAGNERIVYCPLAYGYSNYAREGYAERVLKFGDVPTWNGTPLQTTLGGTGLALSALTGNAALAAEYARFAASAETQRSLSTPAGGQPGHRSAWTDTNNNEQSGNYFEDTLPALDRAFLRPRYCGYTRFQEEGGPILHEGLRGKVGDGPTLEKLDTLYRATIAESK